MGATAEPMATEVRRTACSLDCFDTCGIVAHVEDGRIVRLGGDPDHPITRGALCNKVNHYLRDRFYHPERRFFNLYGGVTHAVVRHGHDARSAGSRGAHAALPRLGP